MPSTKYGLSIVLTAIVMKIVALVLTIFYRKELFKMSLDFILAYQGQQSNSFVIGLMNLMSVLCSIFVTGFLVFLHFFLKRKLVIMILIYYLLINAYIMAIQKQIYQDPRPFVFNLNVELIDWSCEPSYGFPSGHSWVCFFIYQIVVSDLVGTKGWKKLFLLFVAGIGILNPISRMFLGSHSGDQILYGLFNSLIAAVLFRYVLQRQIYKLMKNALLGRHYNLILALNTIIFLLAIAVTVIFYEVNTEHRLYPQLYIDRFSRICGKEVTYTEIERSHGISVTIVSVPFGIIYGFLMSCKMSKKFTDENVEEGGRRNHIYAFLVGNWKYGGMSKVIKYLVVNVGFIVLFLVGFTVLLPTSTENFYGMMILNIFGYLMMGISLSFFIPLLLINWNAIELVYPKPIVNDSQSRLNRSL